MPLIRPWIPLVCAAAPWFSACVGGTSGPNLVLVVSDDQDNEHFGFRGHPQAATPTLDRLAATGTVFPVMHAQARCRPSLAVLLSGRLPHQSGIYYNQGPAELDPAGSLPSRLRQAGYATYLGGKYWEGDLAAMGFDAPAENDVDFARNGQADLFEFLREHAGEQPFFVFWAPAMPHLPHDAPEEQRARIDRDAIELPGWYTGDPEIFRDFEHDLLAMGAWFDHELGLLLDEIESLGVLEETLFLFLVDNGYCNGLISKASPYEKGVSTPAILCWPGHVPVGIETALVSSLDVYPTLLDYAGVAVTDRPGRSLRALVEGGSFEPREALHGAIYPRTASGSAVPGRDVYALYRREPRWKYVYYTEYVPAGMWEITRGEPLYRHERRDGEENLYDLATDPYELVDLSSDPAQRERCRSMREAVIAWWHETDGGELELPPN